MIGNLFEKTDDGMRLSVSGASWDPRTRRLQKSVAACLGAQKEFVSLYEFGSRQEAEQESGFRDSSTELVVDHNSQKFSKGDS